MIYKISYVVQDQDHPGAIANTSEPPKVGDRVHLGDGDFEVVEVFDLMPPRGDFHYLHVTCRTIATAADE